MTDSDTPEKRKVTVNAPISTAIKIRNALRDQAIPAPFRRAERCWYPWRYVQLSKAERKGKTADEIEEARKVKWGRMTDTPIDKAVDAVQENKGEEKE